MTELTLLRPDSVPETLLVDINRRDAALWVQSVPEAFLSDDAFLRLVSLPWRMVVSELATSHFVNQLEHYSHADEHLIRKRGYLQIFSEDPSRIPLPNRCLPIYLLNGISLALSNTFEKRFHRMAMLEELRRSGIRQLVIISSDGEPLPLELTELWHSGLRCFLTFITETATGHEHLRSALTGLPGLNAIVHLSSSQPRAIADILTRFVQTFPEERIFVRVRDRTGTVSQIDATEMDDAERPLLDHYDLIQEQDLSYLSVDQLSEEEFVGFFETPDYSWTPYAAGLPWHRDASAMHKLQQLVGKLNAIGPEANCVAYVTAEPGAGATTLTRSLGWSLAQEGYPVLVAKGFPFVPDAVKVANFINRVRLKAQETALADSPPGAERQKQRRTQKEDQSKARYEVPWVVVFDRIHWEYRESELKRFRNEMEKHGRPVCILLVTGPVRDITFFDRSVFHEIAQLNHTLSIEEARALGQHLNQFLIRFGKARESWQWDRFYQQHTIRHLEGVAAFWVTLSFWIQGQYDLTDSIQEWIYKCFRDDVPEQSLKHAILDIAALSAERLPMAEGLLPYTVDDWPVSHVLDDRRGSLGPIGLVRISANGLKYWSLVHDVLGRFLINALFYDFSLRSALGYEEATDPDHLRFMVLERISQRPQIAERALRDIGDDFATTIFKIDPDHGYGTFASIWRKVLRALEGMPRPLQDGSRVFRHHTAVTRRRIARLNSEFYQVSDQDKIELLTQAVTDLRYALDAIAYVPGSESDVNLFNSLAHAYHDLAEVKERSGSEAKEVQELRRQAKIATRQAYETNPSNSFVIETYVRDLLVTARSEEGSVTSSCVEAMGILYSAISSNEEGYRRARLGELADEALAILFDQAPELSGEQLGEPADAVELLTRAWVVLAQGVNRTTGTALSELPSDNRVSAIDVLSNPVGRANMQVLRLSYDLVSTTYPYDYTRQMELVEQLANTDYRLSPQVRLEYAILLYQVNRAKEGDYSFRELRRLWRRTEYFVQVPNRLRWLRDENGARVRTVNAVVGSDQDLRTMARVSEFRNMLVPFRPEEIGIGDVRPGIRFTCRVSFGHNGPFLRPTTAPAT